MWHETANYGFSPATTFKGLICCCLDVDKSQFLISCLAPWFVIPNTRIEFFSTNSVDCIQQDSSVFNKEKNLGYR